ncbi:MAG: PAS domain-containing protein [Gemmataceae bacterium]
MVEPSSPSEHGPGSPLPELLWKALDALAAHVALLDPAGAIVLVNRAWREFAVANGGQLGQLVEGANYLAVCRRDGEEGAAFAVGLDDVLTGRAAAFTYDYACHSPTEGRWFRARVERLDVSGGSYVLVVHENVTDRKRLEEAYQETRERLVEVLEGTADAVLAVNVAWRFTYLNRAAESLLGRTREGLLGEVLWDAFPDFLATPFEEHLRRAAATRTPVGFPRYWGDRHVLTQVRASPVHDGLLVYLHDLTEARRLTEAEDAAQLTTEQAAAMEREIAFLHALAGPQATATSVLFDGHPLPTRLPKVFAELARDLAGLMDRVVDAGRTNRRCWPTSVRAGRAARRAAGRHPRRGAWSTPPR